MSIELERLKGIERQRELLIKSINKLRESLALEDDPLRKVRYEEQLYEKEAELRAAEAELRDLFSIHSYTGKSLLAEQVRALGVGRHLANIDLVNCNRNKAQDRFWDWYDRMGPHRLQLYLLTSCETQKPGSFAERMLYEYLSQELGDANDAIYYQPDPQFAEMARPCIDPLPVGRNEAKCQDAFRKYFAEFWKLGEQQSMDEYLRHGLPRSGYDAAALFFHIEASAWKPDVTLPYLQWIVDTLQTAHADVPRLLVFLKVNFTNAHLLADALNENPAFRDIKSVLAQHPGVAHLLPLDPVRKEDVMAWFRSLNTQHTALLDKLLAAFSQGLDAHDQQLYRDQQVFNMDDVETLQWEVFNVVNPRKK